MTLYAAWANENHQKLLQRIPSNPYNLTLCRQTAGERTMLKTVIMSDYNMSWNILSNTHKVFYPVIQHCGNKGTEAGVQGHLKEIWRVVSVMGVVGVII